MFVGIISGSQVKWRSKLELNLNIHTVAKTKQKILEQRYIQKILFIILFIAYFVCIQKIYDFAQFKLEAHTSHCIRPSISMLKILLLAPTKKAKEEKCLHERFYFWPPYNHPVSIHRILFLRFLLNIRLKRWENHKIIPV